MQRLACRAGKTDSSITSGIFCEFCGQSAASGGEPDGVVADFLDEIGLGEVLNHIFHCGLFLPKRLGDLAVIELFFGVAGFEGDLVELDEEAFVGGGRFLGHFFLSLAPWGVSSMR